ncbi:hypothetical protein Acr_24g0008130 [Actinidia rufa]|uniref:Uncharacterized protein n=1 Tax=Actinidia rufa TaxID=165716 RepID=A0A7J0GV09_9ERIC|nr:hypothetical protein Acr_24g0008130 [Actinidia rufa]
MVALAASRNWSPVLSPKVADLRTLLTEVKRVQRSAWKPRQAISTELAQSQSAVSSSPLGQVEYLARSSPTRILSIHGNYPLRDSLHHDTQQLRDTLQMAIFPIIFLPQQFGAVYGNDSSRSSTHLRSRHLPRPSASSPPDNRAHPMANPGQIPDLEGLHREIHGMAEQMRIMNENNGRLMQLLAAANPPLPAAPVPDIERSRHSNRSGDRSQNISTERVRERHRAPSPSLIERSSSSESSKTPTRARRERSPHRGNHIDVRNKSTSQKIQDLDARLDAINTGTNAPVTVDTLIRQTEPPFTRRVMRARISSKFKLPAQLGVYEGKTDPMDHLDSYKSLMSLQGCSDEDSDLVRCSTPSPKTFLKHYPPSKAKADKYIAVEELAEAKRRRRGKDDHKRKEPDARRIDYRDETRYKRPDRDPKRSNDRRPRTPPRCPEFIPTATQRPPLPKYSLKLSTKNLLNGLEKSRLTPRRETGTNTVNSTEITDITLRTVFN